MRCKKCGSEKIVKNGLRRGKPCYLCKNCKHQFTNEIAEPIKYNNYDKYIAIWLYQKHVFWKRKHKFINAELRTTHIAKILGIKYTTVFSWVGMHKKLNKKIGTKYLIMYLKNRENGRDIVGLLYPDKIHFEPSEKLLEIVKHKR